MIEEKTDDNSFIMWNKISDCEIAKSVVKMYGSIYIIATLFYIGKECFVWKKRIQYR